MVGNSRRHSSQFQMNADGSGGLSLRNVRVTGRNFKPEQVYPGSQVSTTHSDADLSATAWRERFCNELESLVVLIS